MSDKKLLTAEQRIARALATLERAFAMAVAGLEFER